MRESKLTDEQKKAICLMLDLEKWTQKEVAQRYGVVPSTINKLYKEHCNKKGVNDDNAGVENNVEKGKTILDTDEVRLINKTLMEENERLMKDNDILKVAVEGYRRENRVELSENAARMKFYFDKMLQIYIEKNKKYGNSFSKTYQEYGNIVLLLRIEDKLARAKQLLMNNEAGTADESILDTLIDLANYSVMSVLELENEKS